VCLYRKGASFQKIFDYITYYISRILSNFSQSCITRDARDTRFFKSPSCLRFRRESGKVINFRSRDLAAASAVPEKFSNVINVPLAEAVTLISAGRDTFTKYERLCSLRVYLARKRYSVLRKLGSARSLSSLSFCRCVVAKLYVVGGRRRISRNAVPAKRGMIRPEEGVANFTIGGRESRRPGH